MRRRTLTLYALSRAPPLLISGICIRSGGNVETLTDNSRARGFVGLGLGASETVPPTDAPKCEFQAEYHFASV